MCVAAALLVAPSPARGQDVALDVRLSSDSVLLGDRVHLDIVTTSSGGVVFFAPDSLTAAGLEPLGPVQSIIPDDASEGSRRILRYPMIALDVGPLEIPSFPLAFAPRADAIAAGLTDGGSPVASWGSFAVEPGRLPTASVVEVPPVRVTVGSVLALDDVTTRLAPRPPADVAGSGRDLGAALGLVLSALLLLGVVALSLRDWRETRRRALEAGPPDPRTAALSTLDEVMAAAHHRTGRVEAFYAGTTDAVRRYLETFDPRWDPAWTSTELLTDLQGARRGLAARHGLHPEGAIRRVRLAEEVKFGGLRPDPSQAEDDWAALRRWVADSRLPGEEAP